MGNNIYDLVFHLVGKQQIPNLLGIQNIISKKHIFIHTKEYDKSYYEQLISNDYEFDTILVDAYDRLNIKENIENYLKDYSNKKIAFNLTGGTKIMGFTVYDICNKLNADSYYFDTQNRKLICINKSEILNINTIKSLGTFFDLGKGMYFVNNSNNEKLSQTRKDIDYLLYKYNKDIKVIIKQYKSINPDKNTDSFLNSTYKHIHIEYKNKMHYKIKINNIMCEFKEVDFLKYMNGMWFEEYIFLLVEKYRQEYKNIYDVRRGVVLYNQQSNDFYHELDVVFTDGLNLYFIECKSGKTKPDDIDKINNIAEKFGGPFAKPIFISIDKNKSIAQRYGRNNYIYGNQIEKDLFNYLDHQIKKK